jgi:uncharacterized protein YdeI (YjbR/CyaY-like superfamily)
MAKTAKKVVKTAVKLAKAAKATKIQKATKIAKAIKKPASEVAKTAPVKTAPVKAAPAKAAPADLEILPFATGKAWAAWLKAHYDSSAGLWIKFAKKGNGIESIYYPEALDEALCYGWIDGQARSLDAQYYLQRFTPRTKRSIWSKINRVKVQALIDSGRMKPAGQKEIDRAKEDGRWEAAYDSPSNAVVPDDLTVALAKNAKARAFFETLTSQNRYALLFRIHHAKKAETRARRIDQFVEMLARGETFH